MLAHLFSLTVLLAASWTPSAWAAEDTATLGFRGRPVGRKRVGVEPWSGGILVRQTIDQCPADALLKVGDVVVAYDDRAVRTRYRYLTHLRRSHAEGDAIEVVFVRDGEEARQTVRLGSLSEQTRRRAPLCDGAPEPAVDGAWAGPSDKPAAERRTVQVGAAAVLGWSSLTRIPPGADAEVYGRTVGRLHGTGRAAAYFFSHRGTARNEARGSLRRRYFGVGVTYGRYGSRYRDAEVAYILASSVGFPLTWRTDYRPLARSLRWTFEWGLQPGYELSQRLKYKGRGEVDLLEEHKVEPIAALARVNLGLVLETGLNVDLPGRHDLRVTARVNQRLNPDVHFGYGVSHELGLGLGLYL